MLCTSWIGELRRCASGSSQNGTSIRACPVSQWLTSAIPGFQCSWPMKLTKSVSGAPATEAAKMSVRVGR